MPVFKPGLRVGPGYKGIQVSYVNGRPRVLISAKELTDFRKTAFEQRTEIYPTSKFHTTPKGKVRAHCWKYADVDDDGDLDLFVGIKYWGDYGWDDAFDSTGQWTRGPLHGYVYIIQNDGTTEKPQYAQPKMIEAGGRPIDVYGMPAPNLADFDGDGDLDIICGEFLDKLSYFENIGTRKKPEYAEGRYLTHKGRIIKMDLEMIIPAAIDWDKDGDIDLVVGQEDGRVALIENTGKVTRSMPQFLPPKFFRQQARDVKFGALVTPYSFDWDGDGDEDLLCGNTAGYIGFIENLDGGYPPKWARPKYLKAAGKVIRIQAGPNGSIQGPCEAKWGYTTLNVADWDHDGLADVVVNSIWGKVIWYRNVGTRKKPKLTAARPIQVEWPGKPPKPQWNWWDPKGRNLATQWRTTPVVIDLNRDSLNDLIMLDHEGYLAFFERTKKDDSLKLLPGKRIFRNQDKSGELLRLSSRRAGGSGRRKLCFADWDRDGRLDILINSRNINLLQNTATKNSPWLFTDTGELTDKRLAGHSTSPTIVDWNKDKTPDLLIGAEDGFLYYLPNPNTPK